MSTPDVITLEQEMDNIWSKTLKCRSLFPYADKTIVGCRKVRTAPYYRQFGFNVEFDFGSNLTIDDIDEINVVGHFINQNFVVRLYSLMENYGIIGNSVAIDKSIVEWEELDILRRLRQRFAHSSGRYNPGDAEQKKLYERITAHFELRETDPQGFPLSIDAVLERLLCACRRYAKEFLKRQGSNEIR